MNNTELIIIKEALSRFSRFENREIYKSVQQIEPMSQPLRDKLDDSVSELYAANNRAFTFKKTIAILIAATLLIACLSVGAYAISEKLNIGGFWVEWFEGHIKLSPDKPATEYFDAEKVVISYTPEGFVNTNMRVFNNFSIYNYENGTATIEINVYMIYNGNIDLSTDNKQYSTLTIGDFTVHKTEGDNDINALWTNNEITYYIRCTNLPWEEMVKIIEGISYEE